MKGSAAEGATRSNTQARGAGLGGVGNEDEPAGLGRDLNKVKEMDQRYKGPVNTKEKENPNETEAKHQAKTGIGTNGRHEDKETKAKYQARNEAKSKYDETPTGRLFKNLHQADDKNHTGRIVKKYQAKMGAMNEAKTKYDEAPTGMLVKNLHQADDKNPTGRNVKKYEAKMGAMTDPDQGEKETEAKHQADNKDPTGELTKGHAKRLGRLARISARC